MAEIKLFPWEQQGYYTQSETVGKHVGYISQLTLKNESTNNGFGGFTFYDLYDPRLSETPLKKYIFTSYTNKNNTPLNQSITYNNETKTLRQWEDTSAVVTQYATLKNMIKIISLYDRFFKITFSIQSLAQVPDKDKEWYVSLNLEQLAGNVSHRFVGNGSVNIDEQPATTDWRWQNFTHSSDLTKISLSKSLYIDAHEDNQLCHGIAFNRIDGSMADARIDQLNNDGHFYLFITPRPATTELPATYNYVGDIIWFI